MSPFLFSSRFPLLLLLLFILFFLLIHNLHLSPNPSSTKTPIPISPSTQFLSLSTAANSSISSHLRSLTSRPHLAGTPSAAASASYIRHHLSLAGLRSQTLNYSVLLSYPASSSLSIHLNETLIKHLSLAEPSDPAAVAVPPYHSFSPSGSVFAPAVYVNLGRDEDYAVLDGLSVGVRGCVAVVRRGGGVRGDVVAAAAARGVKAVIMFGKGDGGGVERGTVMVGGSGDLLTPGWAARETAERLGWEDEEVRRRFPGIPSMPVSRGNAVEILEAIGGPLASLEWREGVPEVVGVGGGDTMINFTYQVYKELLWLTCDMIIEMSILLL